MIALVTPAVQRPYIRLIAGSVRRASAAMDTLANIREPKVALLGLNFSFAGIYLRHPRAKS